MNDIDLLIQTLFGPQSLLAQTIPHYEAREAQTRMARRVAEASLNEQSLLVEAATGTGKTLAYLLPLLALGRKVVVATATKALQDQIVEKDLPLIRRIMAKPFTFTSLKGRANYLCLTRFRLASHGGTVSAQERPWLAQVKAWVPETSTGDRDELQDLPEHLSFWFDISAGGDHCIGRKCADYDDCFLSKARQRAKKVDLVVVNHHLYFADLAVREGGFGEILPSHDVAVFDEAHRIPDVVTAFFGAEISNLQISELVRDSRLEFDASRIDDPMLYHVLPLLEEAAHALRAVFPTENCRDGLADQDMNGPPGQAVLGLESVLYHYREVMEPHRGRSTTMAALFRRCETLLESSGLIRSLDDPSRVHWFETRGRGLFLRASPLETGPTLRTLLYPLLKTAIFTSATLSTGSGPQGFAYFREQLGLNHPRVTVEHLPPPFDHRRQTLLFVPRDLPEPNDPRYPDAVGNEIEQLIRVSRGRALCLFTSNRMMHLVGERLRVGNMPYPVMMQGEQSKGALLAAFKTDISSVLLGVASFWEGVDVPGEALSLVVVDRLPFASPSDPLVAARSRWLKAQNHNPFARMSVPQAIITLKQGVGRLLRRQSDRGVMVVLDGRIVSKSYGRQFIAALPPAPLTHDRREVGRFFANE